jgi:hypothetical protein
MRPKVITTCKLMDESFGPARAFQDVWINHGQNVYNVNNDVINIIAHRLPTFSGFSSTFLQVQ